MVRLNAHFDGKVLVPDEPLALQPNQKVRISIEVVIETPRVAGKRTFLPQPGAILSIASDFDGHLGDDYWGLGDDE